MVQAADPADKADIYAKLRLTPTYQPEEKLVQATIKTGLDMCKGFVSEGGLEFENAGNFPNSGKFPWVQLNGRCPQAPGICVPSRFTGRAAGDVRGGPLRGRSDAVRRSRSVLSAESGQAKYPPDMVGNQAGGMAVGRHAEPDDLGFSA